MLSIPGIEALANGGTCAVELMVEITDSTGAVRRYVNGPRDQAREIGGEARTFEGGDTPLVTVSPPRINSNFERQECTIGIASDDTRALELAFASGGAGNVRAELWMYLGKPVDQLVELFEGRLGGMAIDAENTISLTFFSGYGQIDAQRSVHATDDEQRAYAPSDDSLTWIADGQAITWGRDPPPMPAPPAETTARVEVRGVFDPGADARAHSDTVVSMSATIRGADQVAAVEAVSFRGERVERLDRTLLWRHEEYMVSTALPADDVAILAANIPPQGPGQLRANAGVTLRVLVRYRDAAGTFTIAGEARFVQRS